MEAPILEDSEAYSPHGSVRVAPLSNIEPLLRSLGFDPEPVFRSAGFNPADFLDTEHRIPYANGSHLLGQCTRTTGNDQFGLLLGQFFQLEQLGIPGMLALTASNVSAALHDIVHLFGLHDQGGVVTLNTSSRYTTMGYSVTMMEAEAVDQIYDLCIAICCKIMRSFCGSEWNPSRVELSRRAPVNSKPYKDYFRAPVVFDSIRNAVVFSNKWLNCPLVTADADYHEDSTASALDLLQAMPNYLTLEVRIALYSRLAQATCNAATIAELLDMPERTIHRRLHNEGTNFRKLLDETRKISSANYLKSTTLSIRNIARALGYGSTDAFDHAFKRWYGKSPKQWRNSGTDKLTS